MKTQMSAREYLAPKRTSRTWYLDPPKRKHEEEQGLGRWIYCKYCYKNVLPIINDDGSLVACAECGYGLKPLEEEESK